MSDYIKRGDVLKIYENEGAFDYVTPEDIMKIPSADVEPVRHGRWESFDEHSWTVNFACRCQICGWLVNSTQALAFAYCPNCGARMDGKEQEK